VTELSDALAGAQHYDLEQPRYAGAPVWPAHEPGVLLKLHRRHEAGLGEARTSASALLVMAEHSGTHIDALCHQAENLELHGGVRVDAQVQTPEGFTQLGIDTVPPLFARGVLLDCADAGHAIGAEDLERAAEGLEIGAGDVILIRTGAGALWHDPEAFLAAGGIDASGSRWCAERRPLAVGADNMAWDVPGEDDPELGSLPGHLILLVREGIYIIEALNLEALARDGVREFAFACLPLKLRGGTGSPVRPIALV
jgi:kynurenine formamidase